MYKNEGRSEIKSEIGIDQVSIEYPADYESEDARLQNWNKWVQVRQKLAEKFANKMQRQSTELVMNSEDAARSLNERKMVLEYAKVYKKATVRGRPWDQPFRLRQECPCEPVYEMAEKPQDLGIIPEIEYVTVPEQLKPELGICGGALANKCKGAAFKESIYLAKKEEEMRDKIRNVQKHK